MLNSCSPQASPRGDCGAQFCQLQQTVQIKEIWYNHQMIVLYVPHISKVDPILFSLLLLLLINTITINTINNGSNCTVVLVVVGGVPKKFHPW